MCWKCGKVFAATEEICPDDQSRLLPVSVDDQDDPMIGSLFDGRFRILRKLGEGGMGNVYGARQIDFERDVALKILKSDFVRDENIRKRFIYEARTISKLRHPNVLRVFDFGSAPDGSFYMVMELLVGESLAERLAYRFLNYREIFNAIPPVCGVLSEAHKNNVIHRDLKPENVFMVAVNDREEFAKLLDFGIAKHLGDTTMTRSGTLWGTPAYMSPEQAKGDTVGGPADTYGIGIMLYELICGNLPFNSTTQMGLALKQIQLAARRLSTVPGLENINSDLDDLILQCLEKDPKNRPADIIEVADRLKEIYASFDEADLEIIPAEQVDAIALQDWIAAEGKVDADVSALPAHLKELDRGHTVVDSTAAIPISKASVESSSFSVPRRSVNIIGVIVALALMAFIGVYFVNSDIFVDEVSSNPKVISAELNQVEVVPLKKDTPAEPVKGVTDAAGNAVTVFLHAQAVAEKMKTKESEFTLVVDEEAESEKEIVAAKPLTKKEKRAKKRRRSKRARTKNKKQKVTKAKKTLKSNLESTF